MKNTMKLVGIIALIAVVGFSFAACSNGSTDSGGEPTKFEGRWVNLAALTATYGSHTDYSYTFTGDTWSFVSAGPNDNWTASGTFTFTDTTITFTVTTGGSGTGTAGYTLSGTTLFLTESSGLPYGDFTKQ